MIGFGNPICSRIRRCCEIITGTWYSISPILHLVTWYIWYFVIYFINLIYYACKYSSFFFFLFNEIFPISKNSRKCKCSSDDVICDTLYKRERDVCFIFVNIYLFCHLFHDYLMSNLNTKGKSRLWSGVFYNNLHALYDINSCSLKYDFIEIVKLYIL